MKQAAREPGCIALTKCTKKVQIWIFDPMLRVLPLWLPNR